MQGLVRVERGVQRRIGSRGKNDERVGLLTRGVVAPGIAVPGAQVADDPGTQLIGLAGVVGIGDDVSVPQQGDPVSRLGTGQPGFVDRPAAAERGRAGLGG